MVSSSSSGTRQDATALPSTKSEAAKPIETGKVDPESSGDKRKNQMSNWQKGVVFAILFVVNLLNYMDRFTLAGILTKIQDHYHETNAFGGLIQTTFIIFFMTFSPLFGFIGDRYNRKWTFVAGIALWVAASLGSSFVPSNISWLFIVLRGAVGIGMAAYCIISPTVIADMFTAVTRSKMLMIFYFAVPLGCGLGFILGAEVTRWTGDWQWGIRSTVVLGFACIILLVFFFKEPERGNAECKAGTALNVAEKATFWEDMMYLLSIKTYVISSFAYAGTIFMIGTVTWWLPSVMVNAQAYKLGKKNTAGMEKEISHINFLFGVIACVGGIVGVAVGTLLSALLTSGCGPFKCMQTKRADAIVCAFGAYIAVPSLTVALMSAGDENSILCWIMLSITVTAASFSYATNVDLYLAVTLPQKRSSAGSMQSLVSHLFGDAAGPYIVGLMSDQIRGQETSPKATYESLTKSLYLCVGFLAVSAILYTAAAFTVVNDKEKFQEDLIKCSKGKIDTEETKECL